MEKRLQIVVEDGDIKLTDSTIADLRRELDFYPDTSYIEICGDIDLGTERLNIWHSMEENDEQYNKRIAHLEKIKMVGQLMGKQMRRQQYLELKKEFENE